MKKIISLSQFIDYIDSLDLDNSEYKERAKDYGYDAILGYELIIEYNKFLKTPITIEMFEVDFLQPSLFPNFSNVQCIGEIYSHTITNGIINPYWFNIITQTWETNLKTISDLVQYSLEYDETLINN